MKVPEAPTEFQIRLPNGKWEGQDSITMTYAPPESMKNGSCLRVEAHSGDIEHTLNTFFRNLSRTHIPSTNFPSRDYVILFPERDDKLGVYFSIDELKACQETGIDHAELWERFKKLYFTKIDNRKAVLNKIKNIEGLKRKIGMIIQIIITCGKDVLKVLK